jgi:hypothetical protein
LAQPRPLALAPRCFWQLFSTLFSALFAKFVFAAAVEDTFLFIFFSSFACAVFCL